MGRDEFDEQFSDTPALVTGWQAQATKLQELGAGAEWPTAVGEGLDRYVGQAKKLKQTCETADWTKARRAVEKCRLRAKTLAKRYTAVGPEAAEALAMAKALRQGAKELLQRFVKADVPTISAAKQAANEANAQ